MWRTDSIAVVLHGAPHVTSLQMSWVITGAARDSLLGDAAPVPAPPADVTKIMELELSLDASKRLPFFDVVKVLKTVSNYACVSWRYQ